MAPEDEGNRIEAVVTCEGNLHDPDFSIRFQELVDKLKSLLHLDDEKEEEESPLEVKKIEPWNSVRVTISIPKEAAERLRFLAQSGSELLRQLGILSVQVEGDQVISLTFANHGEVVLRQPEDSSSHSASSSHHSDLSSCATSSTFLSDLDILGLPLEHLTQSSPVNVSGPNGGLSLDLLSNSSASSGGGSAFRSPNTVAPSGESIPFFPPKTVVLGPPRPPPGGPYPFASMTHAAHAHAMQRSDHPSTPTTPTPTPPGTPNSGSGSGSSSATTKSTNILTQNVLTPGGNDPGGGGGAARFVYNRSNSAISQANNINNNNSNSSQSLQIQVVSGAGAGQPQQPAGAVTVAPPPYPQQQQQLQHINALRFQHQQQLVAQQQQQQQQQVASPGSGSGDKPMASSPLLVNLLQHGDNFSNNNSSSSPTTPTQTNYAASSTQQQQQMPPPPLTMTLSVDNNNAKRYQLFSSHPQQQHQLQQQQLLQQQLQQLQQKKGVRRGLSLDTSINAPSQQTNNPGGVHGSLSQPGSPAMAMNSASGSATPTSATPTSDGGFQFAQPLPLSSTSGVQAQGQGQPQDGSGQRPQAIYHQQGSFRVLNPAQLLAFHQQQQQQQQGQGQVRGTLRLPQPQQGQQQVQMQGQVQGQGPIRIGQQQVQGGFQLQGRSYAGAGQGGQVQYSVQQGQSQVQNVQQGNHIQIQGQGQGPVQGIFQTQQGVQMQIQQNRLQGNIQIQNRGPIQAQNQNAFQQQQQQMQGQMRAHIRNLGPLQFQNQNQNQNQNMVQIQRPGQQPQQIQQNQMMNQGPVQNQTHPQGSLHLQIQNQLQSSLDQMQQNQNQPQNVNLGPLQQQQNQQLQNSQMQMQQQQQQHLQNYNNQSPMGSPQYHNLAPPQSPLNQGSPDTLQSQGQGHLRPQIPMQQESQQMPNSLQNHGQMQGQGQGPLQHQSHQGQTQTMPGPLRIAQTHSMNVQSPQSPSPMQMQQQQSLNLRPPQSPSPTPGNAQQSNLSQQQQILMNGPQPQLPSTPTTTTGHLFLAPTSAPPKPMSTKPRPGVSPTTYVAPSKPRMATSQAMGQGIDGQAQGQATYLVQNEAKNTPSHLKPPLMGAAAGQGQPMKKDGHGHPGPGQQPSGKPRLLLINPLTGHLEPMPPSESSSDSEEGDEDEGEAKGKGKPEVASLRRPSLPIHLEGMPPLQLANQNQNLPLLGSRKSQEGPGSPGSGNEKIKLRLKLEKSEPAYKVDISFLKKPERGTISSSPSPPSTSSSSMSPGAFFSRMRMSRPMPPPVPPQTGKPHAIAMQQQQQQQPSTMNPNSPAAAAGGDPPRVPPLHISLRGRNAAVVVSPRREENIKDNISLNLNSGNSPVPSPEAQILKTNSDNQPGQGQSVSGSAKSEKRTKSRLKSTDASGEGGKATKKGSQGQSRPRGDVDDKLVSGLESGSGSYTPGKIRLKSHSLSSENPPLISGSGNTSPAPVMGLGSGSVPKVKSRRKSELIPNANANANPSNASQLFKHLVQSLPIVSQQAATTAAAALSMTSPSPVFTPHCDTPNTGNENSMAMAMDWQGNSGQKSTETRIPEIMNVSASEIVTKSSNIPNVETGSTASDLEINAPKYPTPPSSVEPNPYEFMQHDFAIHGPSPCMGMGFRSKSTTESTNPEVDALVAVPVISKDLTTMNEKEGRFSELTKLPHDVNDAKEKEGVVAKTQNQNHVGGAEIEIRQVSLRTDKFDNASSSSTTSLPLPSVLPITIPSKGPDDPGHSGNGNGNGNGVAGEDSGIDSMDALSEKSPNQGETPPRRESENQNHPFVCDKPPTRSRSTEGGGETKSEGEGETSREGKVPLMNTRLTEEMLTEELLGVRVNPNTEAVPERVGPLDLPNITESENELNIDLPDLIPIDHSGDHDHEELLSNVEAYLGGFDDLLPDADAIQVEFTDTVKRDESQSEKVHNKEDSTTTPKTTNLENHENENENEELKDIQLQGFSPLGAGGSEMESEMDVDTDQKGTDDIFDVKLQDLQEHEKPAASSLPVETAKDSELDVKEEQIQNEIPKPEPEPVVEPVIESQPQPPQAAITEDAEPEVKMVEPLLPVPAQNVMTQPETTEHTQPIPVPTPAEVDETTPVEQPPTIPEVAAPEEEIQAQPEVVEPPPKLEESIPSMEPELVQETPEVPQPMKTEADLPPVIESKLQVTAPDAESEKHDMNIPITQDETLESEPVPEKIQPAEVTPTLTEAHVAVTLPEIQESTPQEPEAKESEQVVSVTEPSLPVPSVLSLEPENLKVPTVEAPVVETVELEHAPMPVILAPEVPVEVEQPEAVISIPASETNEPKSYANLVPHDIEQKEFVEPEPEPTSASANLVEEVKEVELKTEKVPTETMEIQPCVVEEPEIPKKAAVEAMMKSEPEIIVKTEDCEVTVASIPIPTEIPIPVAPVKVEEIPVVAEVQTENVPKQIPLTPQVKAKPKIVTATADIKVTKEEVKPKPEVKAELKREIIKPTPSVTIPNVINVLPTVTARIEPTIATPVATATTSALAPPKLDSEIKAALAKLRPQLTPHFSASLERLPGLPNLVRPKVYPNTQQVHVMSHDIMNLPRLQPKPHAEEPQKQELAEITVAAQQQQQLPPKFPKQQNSLNLPRATVLPNVIQLTTTTSPIPMSMSQVKVTQAQAASIGMNATGTTTIYTIHPHHAGITLASGQKVVPIKLVTLPKHAAGPGGTIVNRGSPSNFLEAIAASAARSGSPMGNPVQSSPLNLSSMGGNVHFVPLSHHSAQSPMKLVVSSPIKVGSPIPHAQAQAPSMLQTVMVKMATNQQQQQQQPHAVQTPTDPPVSTEAEVAHMPARIPEDEPITKVIPATPTPIPVAIAKIEKQPEPEDYSYKNVDGVELLDTTSLEATEDGFPFEADIIHDEKDLADVLASEKVIHNGIGGAEDPYDLSHALAMESNHVDLKFRPVNDDSNTAVIGEPQQSEPEEEEEDENESENEIKNSIPSSPVRIVRSSSPLYTYSNRSGSGGKNSHSHAQQQRSSESSSSRSRSPTPPPDVLHGEDQEIIDSFSDKDDHNYGSGDKQPAAGRSLEALSIEIPADEKPTRSTRSNTRLVSPDITAFRSDTPKPVKLLKPDSVKNSPKPSPTGSLTKHLFLHSPSLRSSPTPALILNSEGQGHNSTNPKNIKGGVVNASCGATAAGSNKRKRRESDSSSASKDETEDGKISESSSDVNSRPGKRRCSENAAELIKACIGVEDTPKRNNSVHHKETTKPKSGKGRKNMHVVPEESDDEFESVEMFVRGMGGRSSRGSSEDRSSSRGSSVHRNSLPPKNKDDETGKEIKTKNRAPNRSKIPKDDTKSKPDGGPPPHQNSNATPNATKKRAGTPNAKRGNKTALKGKSPLTLAKTKTNIRKDLMGVSGVPSMGSDKSSTSTTTSPENENSRRKTRSSVAVGSTDSDSPSQKRRRVSKDTKS